MRLRLLCEALFLLCLCVVPSLAASGQTLAIRRPHQPRKVDQITRTGKDQTPVELPFKSKTVVIPRTIAPRKLLVRRKVAFSRPELQCSSASGVNSATPTSKGSAQNPLPEHGKWLRTLTSLVAVLLLYSI